MSSIFAQHQRQVHLDFHTSPFIPDVGVEFDAEAFAATMEKAHVNSVTVFAKCHHGMCYYPTRTGVIHPALGERDLLGEQIEALHRRGIRAPVYTTVVWEEKVAQDHPEWRQLTREGHFGGWKVGPDGRPGHVGTWQFNDFNHPDYQDYFAAHVEEILARYGKEVDGFFFDILFFADLACYNPASIAFREKHGLTRHDAATFARFQGLSQQAFAQRFTRLVHQKRNDATVFYNTGNDANMHPDVGPRMREPHMTHFEIESLPSGFWGYYHFPRMARHLSHRDKPWLGMTGRFQKMWGDFGGIKPQPALEYECFRAQAMGGANSIGDQLPPRGTLDPAAYELIGEVYRQCAEAEPFYENSSPTQPQVGILTANYADQDGSISDEGAVQLCEDAHYDTIVLDDTNALDGLSLLILSDTTTLSPAQAGDIRNFYENGGCLMISARGGRDENGRFLLDFLPVTSGPDHPFHPTYWRIRETFAPSLANSDRVLYQQGIQLTGQSGTRILVDRVDPYFQRTAITFSSHFQTPPIKETGAFPAVVAGPRFIFFADPIFSEYRQSGNPAVRQVWPLAMKTLIGQPSWGASLSSRIAVYPRRKGNDLLLTLLHYIPVRKAIDIDVIEERSHFGGQILDLPEHCTKVTVYPTGEELMAPKPGQFALPETAGRLLLEVKDYFPG